MSVIGAGLGPIKMLKKAMVVTLASHLSPSPGAQDFARWRENLIPAFTSSFRLYLDFPRDDTVQF